MMKFLFLFNVDGVEGVSSVSEELNNPIRNDQDSNLGRLVLDLCDGGYITRPAGCSAEL